MRGFALVVLLLPACVSSSAIDADVDGPVPCSLPMITCSHFDAWRCCEDFGSYPTCVDGAWACAPDEMPDSECRSVSPVDPICTCGGPFGGSPCDSHYPPLPDGGPDLGASDS